MSGKIKRQRNIIKDINNIFRRLKKLERDTRITSGEITNIGSDTFPSSNLLVFGAEGDGVTDDTETIIEWFEYLSDEGLKGYVPPGIYPITEIDETYNNNLDIECHPDAVFKGSKSYQDFTGNGSQTSFTITDFNWYAAYQGVNVDVVDISTGLIVSQLEPTIDYTISGSVINLAAGSSPYGAVASGDKLRVSSSAPIILLRGDGTKRINWRGGSFDASERGLCFANPSGSALQLNTWNRGHCKDVDFIGADNTYVESRADLISDAGLTYINVSNFTVSGCYFQGWGDLGIYGSGDADSGPEDDGGDISIRDNTFYGCESGLKIVRQSQRTTISGNHFLYCAIGIFNGYTGGIDTGSHYIVTDNTFKFTGRRAIDLRSMEFGATVANNRIEDIGFMPDGTTEYEATDGSVDPAPIAINLQEGTPQAMIHHNYIGMNDWGVNNQRAIVISNPGSPSAPASFYQFGVNVSDNYIADFEEGIVQGGSETVWMLTNYYKDNMMYGVTTPMTIVTPSTRWSYIDVLTDTRYFGRGTATWKTKGNTWTPTFIWSGGGGTFATPSVQRASYNRSLDSGLITLRFELAVNITGIGTGELRVSGLPNTPAALADLTPRAAGSVHQITGPITPPTGTMFYTLRQNAGSATISIVAHGASAGTEFSTALDTTHIATGTTSIYGSLTYEAS